jgi:cellulose synthase/poly-beta-1,6-N-acetylglucosamine synthase-like glycosyltransferase
MSAGVSVVIPFRNSEDTIVATLDSLAMQNYDGAREILLVDDRSTDRTVEIAEQHPVSKVWKIRRIENTTGGLANAYNYGWRASENEIVIFLHSDCFVLSPDALMKIVAPFTDETVVAALPVQTFPSDEWDRMSFWDKAGRARYQGKESCELCGKFDAFRRSTLEKLGGFDGARFYSAGEDVDMAIRLKDEGRIVSTEVRVVHGHKYPPNSAMMSLFRKQAQLAQGFGALLSKHWKKILQPELRSLAMVHGAKGLLVLGLFVPPLSLPCLLILLLLGTTYSRRMFKEKDRRVLLLPFVFAAQFVVFTAYALFGLIVRRQTFYYK